MKLFRLLLILFVAMLAGGCLWHKSAKQAQSPKPAKTAAPAKPAKAVKPAKSAAGTTTIITPDNSLIAKVVSYNSVGRFVVLNFPAGQVPKIDRTVFLYRSGLKVAEARITGPQNDNNIVADLVTGDAQVGDEVRDQ
jgi:hypothetical protein